jgi:hypothetical protein
MSSTKRRSVDRTDQVLDSRQHGSYSLGRLRRRLPVRNLHLDLAKQIHNLLWLKLLR